MNNDFQRDQFALRYIWNVDNRGNINKGTEAELSKFFYAKGRKMGVRGLDKNAFAEDCRIEAFELVGQRWHKVSPHPQTGELLDAITDPTHMVNRIKTQINRDALRIASPYISPVQWSHKQLSRRAAELGVTNSEAVIGSKSWEYDADEISQEMAGKLREDPDDKILTQQVGILANAAWSGVLTEQEYNELIWYYHHGKSLAEIASETSQDQAAVRQRKKRSLKKLEKATRQDPHGRALMDAIGFKDND